MDVSGLGLSFQWRVLLGHSASVEGREGGRGGSFPTIEISDANTHHGI